MSSAQPHTHPHYAHTGLPLTDAVFRARADARSAQLKQQRTAQQFAEYASKAISSQSAFTFQRTRVTDLALCQDNDILTFTPQPDITPLELANILTLLMHATATHAYPDFKEYIARNGLDRHFTQKD